MCTQGEQCMLDLIKLFNKYASQDGDKDHLSKKEGKALLQREFCHFIDVSCFSLMFLHLLYSVLNDCCLMKMFYLTLLLVCQTTVAHSLAGLFFFPLVAATCLMFR